MGTPTFLEQGIKLAFARMWRELDGKSGSPESLMSAALIATSTSREENYGWLGSVPAVREFLSEAQLGQIGDYDFTIRNRTWEASVSMPKDDVEDDQTGQGNASAIGQLLAQKLANHPARLIEDLIIAGTTNLAYDGSAFFADRSVNDNLLAGTGTTLSALATDLASAEAAMLGFKNDQGDYLEILPDLIVCGPSLYNTFMRLVGSNTDPNASAQGTYNPNYGRFRVLRSARIGANDANDWYLFATGGILKPFIVQNRRSPRVEIESRPTVPTYGIVATARGNVGYGLPQLGVKVVES